MMKKIILLAVLNASLISLFAQEVQLGELTGQAGFVNTSNDMRIYYEQYGTGDPLLILHGNSGSVKRRHAIITDLAKTFEVVALDSRCHGNSSCPKEDLTYENMMQDVHKVLEELDLKNVMIWGHSDGGILGVTLLVGDRDAMPLAHTLEIFYALPKANLAVFPETTHFMEDRQDDIVDLLNELQQPFKAPSTVDVAKHMARQIFGSSDQ
ncbi:MAG: alpha/beta hydrolase [Bacteroidota bacterium]